MKHPINSLLAEQRTNLAAIRTLLSFIRTGLVCISVALAFVKLQKENSIDPITVILFVVGALFIIGGIIEFVCATKKSNDIMRMGLKHIDN